MRGPIWKKAVTRYAIPNLNGTWSVNNGEIILQPVGLIACAVFRINSSYGGAYHLYATVQPLYIRTTGWQTMTSVELKQYWPDFATPEDGEPHMHRFVDAIHAVALPHFAHYGTPDGYRQLCQKKNHMHPTGIGDPHYLTHQAQTEIILEHYKDATETLTKIRRVLETTGDSRPFMRQILDEADTLRSQLDIDPQIVRESLLENIDAQRTLLKLPPSK